MMISSHEIATGGRSRMATEPEKKPKGGRPMAAMISNVIRMAKRGMGRANPPMRSTASAP